MPVTRKPAADEALAALIRGAQKDPFAVLGPHADPAGGILVRAFQPAARSIELRLRSTGALVPMEQTDPAGVFEVRLEGQDLPDYRLKITYSGDQAIEIDDPYRYGRVLTDFDLHLLSEGTHFRAFEKLGAHRVVQGTTTGVHFAVWAPNADRVSVIGDFNGWDGRVTPMRFLTTGVWEVFIPGFADEEKYKFECTSDRGRACRRRATAS